MNRSITCLLIEDDPDDQEIFLTALQDAYPRATCWVAENCVQALERMKSRLAPIPDYIFLDWNLPLMDAPECINQIRESGLHNVCMFVISGTVPPMRAENLKLLRIKEVITKQLSIKELSHELHNVIKSY